MALGVPSGIGIDIAVFGLGSLVVVVESYPSYLDYIPWAVIPPVVGPNHLNFEEFLQVCADLPLPDHVEAPGLPCSMSRSTLHNV